MSTTTDTPAVAPSGAPAPASGATVRARGTRLARLTRVRPLVAVTSALAVAALWEAYKLLGPAQGWAVGETRLLPRTTDLAMPHTWQVAARLLEPVSGATGADVLWLAVLRAGAFSFGIALVGWTIGVLVGALLALTMLRVAVVERAVLPLVVLSQTVPLIALAPLVRSWGARLEIGSFAWQPWMSVAVIASYLAFFPVAVGALRGLQSPDRIHVDLMRACGAGWGTTLVRL